MSHAACWVLGTDASASHTALPWATKLFSLREGQIIQARAEDAVLTHWENDPCSHKKVMRVSWKWQWRTAEFPNDSYFVLSLYLFFPFKKDIPTPFLCFHITTASLGLCSVPGTALMTRRLLALGSSPWHRRGKSVQLVKREGSENEMV